MGLAFVTKAFTTFFTISKKIVTCTSLWGGVLVQHFSNGQSCSYLYSYFHEDFALEEAKVAPVRFGYTVRAQNGSRFLWGKGFPTFEHNFREQKRHIRKNHINFLKTPGRPGVPGTPGGVSRQKCQFFYSKQQELSGTPAGRPLFVPPGVPGTPGRCPVDFLKFMCLFVLET